MFYIESGPRFPKERPKVKGDRSDGWRHAVPTRVVATPLLGAGAKLASAGEAAEVAAAVLSSIELPPPLGTDGGSQWVVRFGLLEKNTAAEIAAALDSVL